VVFCVLHDSSNVFDNLHVWCDVDDALINHVTSDAMTNCLCVIGLLECDACEEIFACADECAFAFIYNNV